MNNFQYLYDGINGCSVAYASTLLSSSSPSILSSSSHAPQPSSSSPPPSPSMATSFLLPKSKSSSRSLSPHPSSLSSSSILAVILLPEVVGFLSLVRLPSSLSSSSTSFQPSLFPQSSPSRLLLISYRFHLSHLLNSLGYLPTCEAPHKLNFFLEATLFFPYLLD